MPLTIILLSHSNSGHLQQLYTGFKMLNDSNLIQLKQKIVNRLSINTDKQYLRDADHAILRIILYYNDMKIKICYDTHDSYEILPEYAAESDFYFKRSYLPSYVKSYKANTVKILPLGLNYLVFPNNVDRFYIWRTFKINHQNIRYLKRTISPYPKLYHIESFPQYFLQPRVIFQATAYDPYDVKDRPQEKIEERIKQAEFRASCIKYLRKELKNKAIVGFVHNNFTKRKYPDLLLDNPKAGQKRNYLNLLKQCPICIATTGLHGSIGWKFAEYIALSKAVVCEPLNYSVPGNLAQNQNYMTFTTPEECVSKCLELISNDELTKSMMYNNYIYYNTYLRPDRLVANTLNLVLKTVG